VNHKVTWNGAHCVGSLFEMCLLRSHSSDWEYFLLWITTPGGKGLVGET
jgi:hypothetical protein